MDASEPAQAPDGGTRGRYRILLELGEGGTARVYLAVTTGMAGFNRLVVLKTLKQNLIHEPALRDMFMSEARLSARLNHENIVGVNQVFEQDGVPVIVMQYLEGQPYSRVISRSGEQLTLGMRLRIISDALSGLHYSHELTNYDGTPLNLVHRDMSPQNLFVTYSGRVKLLDFGIAKVDSSPSMTETGVIKGKLRYMPPEQIAGGAIDRRADVFAAGVMLWEAATRQRMWHKLSDVAMMHKIVNGEVVSPREVNPECDIELETIIMKALAERPEDRHATALELQAQIDGYASAKGIVAAERDIGRLISEVFAEHRAVTKRQIDNLLQQQGQAPESGSNRVSFMPVPRLSSSDTGSPIDVTRSRRRWLLPLALVAAVALTVAFIVRPNPESSSPPVASTPSAPSGSPQAQETVGLRVAAFPREAKILLDGKVLDANPYATQLQPDHEWHVVRAEREGFAPQEQRFKLSADVDLMLLLQKKEAAPKPAATAPVGKTVTPRGPGAVTRKRRAAAPPRSPPKRAKPNCTPPYTIDENGIRKLKPQCL